MKNFEHFYMIMFMGHGSLTYTIIDMAQMKNLVISKDEISKLNVAHVTRTSSTAIYMRSAAIFHML